MTSQSSIPSQVQRLTRSNQLRLIYGEQKFELAAEFLRVHSPSAEVRQHGNPILVDGKADVTITALETVGRYGLKISFNDGHNSGIFTWVYLQELCRDYQQLWDIYITKLHQNNKSRYPERQVVQIQPPRTS